MNWLADKVEHWPTTKLIPYARNARQHSDEQIAKIASSIVAVKRFQQNHPDIPVTLLATGQTFAEVESERLENTDASLAR